MAVGAGAMLAFCIPLLWWRRRERIWRLGSRASVRAAWCGRGDADGLRRRVLLEGSGPDLHDYCDRYERFHSTFHHRHADGSVGETRCDWIEVFSDRCGDDQGNCRAGSGRASLSRSSAGAGDDGLWIGAGADQCGGLRLGLCVCTGECGAGCVRMFSMNGGGGNLVINMPPLASAWLRTCRRLTRTTSMGRPKALRCWTICLGRGTRIARAAGLHRMRRCWWVGQTSSRTMRLCRTTERFAVSGGGGVSRLMGRHFTWNIVEVDYVYSQLPNAVNDHQNDLRVMTGITFRIGPR